MLGMLRRRGVVVAVVALGLGLVASPAAAATWHFETLDGAGGPNGRIDAAVGLSNSTTLYNGTPHDWYLDATGGDLRHAWWTGTAWRFETLDGAGGTNGRIDSFVGGFSATTLYAGQPHVWYYDATNGDLRHAWWTGTTWRFQTLDGAGGANGRVDGDVGGHIAVTVFDGGPHVWYTDFANGDLRHGWWTGTAWRFETLDGAGGTNGRIDASLDSVNAATVYAGQPHVWYSGLGTLRHAWWDGTAWRFETLDGAGGANGRVDTPVGAFPAATVFDGRPHVWYSGLGTLRHGWWDGTTWRFETLDGHGGVNGRTASSVGGENSVTLSGGTPHVWYVDTSNEDLRHAWWTGTAWRFETLDGQGGADGRVTSDVGQAGAPVVYAGAPHVFYYDWAAGNGNLRHAWWG